MASEEYASSIHEYLAKWLEAHDTTWDWLVSQAGAAGGTGTRITRGAIPRPDTLKKLAKVMGVSPATLFLMVGYITEEDLAEGPSSLAPDEESLIADYRALAPRYRRVVLGVTREMLRSGGDSDELEEAAS